MFITLVHSPVALVAIDRNRWSSSTGNGGRLQPETLVAMDRRAQAKLTADIDHTIAELIMFKKMVTNG